MNKVEWRTLTEAYIDGIVASYENRSAEVIKVDSCAGLWHVFFYKDGRMALLNHKRPDTSYREALRCATEYLINGILPKKPE